MDIEHSKATRPAIEDVAGIIVFAREMRNNVALDRSKTLARSVSEFKHRAQYGYLKA